MLTTAPSITCPTWCRNEHAEPDDGHRGSPRQLTHLEGGLTVAISKYPTDPHPFVELVDGSSLRLLDRRQAVRLAAALVAAAAELGADGE